MPSNRRKRVWGRKFPLDKSHFITEIRNTKWRWRLRRNFDSASRRSHFERSREIYIAERSLPDVRQHQDIVFPWRIHADFLQYSKDPSATLGMTMLENPSHQSPVTPNPQSLIPSYLSPLSNFELN